MKHFFHFHLSLNEVIAQIQQGDSIDDGGYCIFYSQGYPK